MPIRPCPTCGNLTPRMLDTSQIALVDYYRCENCSTVFHKPKGAEGPLTIVAAPPTPDRH